MRLKSLMFQGFLSFCGVAIFLPWNLSVQVIPSDHKSWQQYGGSPDQSKYVDFTQITKSNVNQLQVAWTYPANSTGAGGGACMWNPIIAGDVMYVLGSHDDLVALDAVTGKEIWTRTNLTGIVRTGMNYWQSKDGKDRRLLFSMRDTLQAIDATTGKSITTFGSNGVVYLKEAFGTNTAKMGRVQSTSPGQIYDNLILLGSSPGEDYFVMPGHLRAYDVVTGKLVWTFHTIPQPGEYGYETWPKDAYKYVGGVNTWGEITVDEKNGIAFFPLGAPTYDYFGADRIGSDLFGDCLLALDARTGKRLWYFQDVHHDLWDYDLCSAPQLITVQHDGKTVEAVAVAGKQGFLFVFNRLTGEPLWPIVERPVPSSDVPQEQAWPTQPIPTAPPPFTRQMVTTNDINPYFPPEKRAQWIKRVAEARTGLYQPLSDKYEVIAMPGAVGGANRGNTAADPDHGIVYVTSQELPSVYKLTRENPIPSDAPGTESKTNNLVLFTSTNQIVRGKAAYGMFCAPCHGVNLAGMGNFPALTNIAQRLRLGDFKTQVLVGKGQMPGFGQLGEGTIADIYAFCGGDATVSEEHISDQTSTNAPARPRQRASQWNNRPKHYPPGVIGPTNNYTSGYGLEYPDLLTPPWSTITAYDLNQGTIKWRRPLGHDPKIPRPASGEDLGIATGSQRKSMIVTSAGLLFATCLDGKVYAYDTDNGNQLWSSSLPRNTEGLPAMYEVNGRQYLVICSMGKAFDESATDVFSGYIIYALPDSTQAKPITSNQ